MNRIIAIIALLFLTTIVYSQVYTLKGSVVNASTGKTIAGASIFLSNTSYGTVSNNNGNFEINNIRQGKYDLIVSFIGFETYNETITLTASKENLRIQLKEKSKELEGVVVRNYLKDGWEQWGQFFIENFIGTSALGLQCKLKNPDVLKFSHSKKDGLLYVDAMEPLIVENKALGYMINYQLEDFVFNFNTKTLFYSGYPLFTEMEGGKSKQNKWEKARAETYEISSMRFLRSLYRNKIAEDGYEVFKMDRIPNLEKKRLQSLEKAYYDTVSKKFIIREFVKTLSTDSAEYYRKIMAQKDPIEVVHQGKITGNDIAYGADSFTAVLDFKQYLIVRIPSRTNPPEFVNSFRNASTSQPISSVVTLPNSTPIYVTSSGYFYNAQDLLLEGYWGWWEKISSMLPFNYWPLVK